MRAQQRSAENRIICENQTKEKMESNKTTTRSRSEKFEKGLKTRTDVLGSEYVERSLANADDFSWPIQQLSTEYCWDEIWNRPGLDRRSRSILNLGMIAALNRPHELKIHIRGALKNGISKNELREIFLQIACYCGIPAGIDTFRIAREAFKEIGEQDTK